MLVAVWPPWLKPWKMTSIVPGRNLVSSKALKDCTLPASTGLATE